MEAAMKLFGVVNTAVLFLLLGTPASVYAQQEQQNEAKPRPKPTQEAKPAKPQPAQQEAPKPEDRKAANPPQKEQEKRAQDETKKAQEEQTQHAQHQQRALNGQSVGGNRGGRIPEDHFRAHFGREHTFVINRLVTVENRPRFQYSGYWFEIVDPWPVGWAYTDDCYIDYIDDTYYLFDPLHPGVRLVIVVVM
jgi:flagellar motor protein MotB